MGRCAYPTALTTKSTKFSISWINSCPADGHGFTQLNLRHINSLTFCCIKLIAYLHGADDCALSISHILGISVKMIMAKDFVNVSEYALRVWTAFYEIKKPPYILIS